MALPTLTKTWQFNVNQAFNNQGSAAACGRNVVLHLVNSLKNNGWTVRSSSNGTTASATDLWTSATALNWGSGNTGYNTSGGAKSWIVLRNSALGNYEICIELSSHMYNATHYGGMVITAAKGGFATTSLVTTARPALATAGDALINVFANIDQNFYSSWYGGSNTDTSLVCNTLSTTDNKIFRFFVYNSDALVFYLMIEEAGNPISAWTTASPGSQVITWCWCSSTTASDIGGNLWGNGVLQTRIGTTTMGLRTSVECCNTGFVTQGVVNDQTGEYPMIPMGLVCTTAPYRMRVGNITDMWLPQIGLPHGTTFPSDNSRQFLQVGGVIVPWGTSGSPGPVVRTRY